MQETLETQVQSLGREDPLEEEMAPYSSVLAWESPWTGEPGGPWSMGSRKSRTWLSDQGCTYTALSTLLFNVYHYSKTYFQFIALSSYHKAKEHCRKYHLCSSKPLTRSFTRVAFMKNTARNIYLHVALSSTGLSLQHAVSRVVMPGQNLWFVFTA